MSKTTFCDRIKHQNKRAFHELNGMDLCCDCYHYYIPTSGITNTWTAEDWEEHTKKSEQSFKNCLWREKGEKND